MLVVLWSFALDCGRRDGGTLIQNHPLSTSTTTFKQKQQTKQAPLIHLESAALRWLKARGAAPPRALRWLATNALLLWAAHHFFFPPLEVHTDTAQRVAQAIDANARALLAWLEALPAAIIAAAGAGGARRGL